MIPLSVRLQLIALDRRDLSASAVALEQVALSKQLD